MLALIYDNNIVSTISPGSWFDLPNGSRASPAHDGWTDGEHRLAAILPSNPVPEGKRVASTDVQLIEGQPRYVHVLEDAEADPPTPEKILASLPNVSHAQIIAALIGTGILTEAEGVDWITGTLPASVEAMIAALPAEQRTIARLRAIRPSSVVPTDPLVGALAASEGKSVEDLIDIFTSAAAL